MHSPTPGSRLRRLLDLSAREKRLLLEAWWRLLAATIRLRLAPRQTVARALAEPPAATPGAHEAAGTSEASFVSKSGEATDTAQAVALAVSRAAAHHLGAMTCLPRAVALQKMLARRGISSALRIGVRKEPAGSGGSGGSRTIAAHAWVEVEGQALGEPTAIEERFRPLLPALDAPRNDAR